MKLTTHPFAGMENLARVYEICRTGEHHVFFVRTETNPEEPEYVHPVQLKKWEKPFLIISEEWDGCTDIPGEADIFFEVTAPSFDTQWHTRQEPMEDIEIRIDKARPLVGKIPLEINEAAHGLLKVAYEKLGMTPYELPIIISLARTIAALDWASNIEVRHVAEAIQYRSIDRKFK